MKRYILKIDITDYGEKMKKILFALIMTNLLFVAACSNEKISTPCPLNMINPNSCEFGTYTTTENGCSVTLCRPSSDFDCRNLKVGDSYYDGCNTCGCGKEGSMCTMMACEKTIEKINLDDSCNVDSDCEVKDVGNCCGYYPKCLNKDAVTNPKAVQAECQKRGLVSDCGFPDIKSCSCENKKCVAN